MTKSGEARYPPFSWMELKAAAVIVYHPISQFLKWTASSSSALSSTVAPSKNEFFSQPGGSDGDLRLSPQDTAGRDGPVEDASLSPRWFSAPVHPQITFFDTVLSGVTGFATAAAIEVFLSKSSWLSLESVMVFAAVSCACFSMLRDRRLQSLLVTQEQARYDDSHFIQVESIRVHYLQALPSRGKVPRMSLVMVHGFGVTSGTWRLVLQPLADALCARVIAIDMPGSGLTSKPSDVRDYDVSSMMEAMTSTMQLRSLGPVVVVGHSMGALFAGNFLVTSAQQPDAVVLVSPCIEAEDVDEDTGCDDERHLFDGEDLFGPILRVLTALATYCAVQTVLVLMPALALALRSLFHCKDFFLWPLASAVHPMSAEEAKARWPMVFESCERTISVRGWDASFLKFILFRVSRGKGLCGLVAEAVQDRSAECGLVEMIASSQAPTMVLHGEQDAVIPFANGVRLAARTGAEFVAFRGGHTPICEHHTEFVKAVVDFVSRSVAS